MQSYQDHKVDGPPDLSYNRWDHSEWREGIHQAHSGLRDQHHSMCLESRSSDVKTGSFIGKKWQTGWSAESPWQRTYEEAASMGTVCPNRDRASDWTFYLPSSCSKMRWMPLASQNKSRQIISLVNLPSHPRCWCTCKSKLVCSWFCAGEELSRYTCDWTSQGAEIAWRDAGFGWIPMEK